MNIATEHFEIQMNSSFRNMSESRRVPAVISISDDKYFSLRNTYQCRKSTVLIFSIKLFKLLSRCTYKEHGLKQK